MFQSQSAAQRSTQATGCTPMRMRCWSQGGSFTGLRSSGLEWGEMDQLLLGYERFRKNYWRHHRHEFVERAQQGQSPWAMVVACCDSRVPPEIIFDCAPGEIFVVRSIANLIPTYAPAMANHGTSAALEIGRALCRERV